MALAELGWTYLSPLVLATEAGQELELDTLSPAMLKKIMLRQYRRNLEGKLDQGLRKRGILSEENGAHWQLVTRALKGLKGLARSRLLQWVWGTSPPGAGSRSMGGPPKISAPAVQ